MIRKDTPDASEPGTVENLGPLLLVANPTSRSGKAALRIETAREILLKHGIDHEFRPTLPNAGTVDMVARAVTEEGFETVVYLGGDGTFNEVAKGICKAGKSSHVQLGMLPSGTANDQGKSFGISGAKSALEKNVKTIKAGHTTWLDVGEITAYSDEGTAKARDLFFDSMGCGLSASILAFRNREKDIVKKMPIWREMYRDQAVYVRAAVHKLAINVITRDRFSAEIIVDGRVHQFDSLSDLVISNTLLYAGEWIIDTGARHDDGMFEIVPFAGTRDWTSKLIVHHKKNPLTEDLLNKIGVSHTPNMKGKHIQVQILRPNRDRRLPAQLDGDEFPQSDHFEVVVHPKLLKIIIPKDHHWI